jgi:hypothetical protein
MTVVTAYNWDTATPSGTALTGSNSGGAAAPSVGAGCSAVSDSTSPLYGSMSAKFTVPATNVGDLQRATIAGGTTTMSFAIPFRIDALPSTGKKQIWAPRYATGYMGRLEVTSTGAIDFADAAGGNVLTTAETVTIGQWYVAKILLTAATSTTGTISVNIYLDDTTTRFNATTLSSSSYNLGTAAVASMDIGSIQNGISASMTISFSQPRYEVGGTSEIPPVTSVIPTPDAAKIGVIGDSLTANMPAGVLSTALQGKGWASGDIYIDGLSGREIWGSGAGGTTPDAKAAIDTMRGTGFEPVTWIIALGTNDATGSAAFCAGLFDSLLQYIGPDRTVHVIGVGYQTETDCAPGYDGGLAAGSRWTKVGAASGSNAAIQNMIDGGLDPATYPTVFFWNWNDWSQLVAHRTDAIWNTDTGAPSGNARHMNSTGYTDYRAPYYALASLGYGAYVGKAGATVKATPYVAVAGAWVACGVATA